MTIQASGEIVFGAGDWAQRVGGTRFGVKVRDFGNGGQAVQLWEDIGTNQWEIRDAVDIEAEVNAGDIGGAMAKVLAMVRKWLAAKFGNGTTPPTLTNLQKLDLEVQKMRFTAGPPPNVLYP